MRDDLDKELFKLNNLLIEMGILIQTAITNSSTALINRDKQLAKETIDFDKYVNAKEQEIESLCLNLIVQQQPVASDFRLISSTLKIITDMERIGDQSADISEIVLGIDESQKLDYFPLLEEMVHYTTMMVELSIEAYTQRNLALSHKVIALDAEVNRLFDIIKVETIKYIESKKGDSHYAVDIIMISKYLERIGDHAQNIAEWVVFAITGEHKDSKVF